MEKSADKDYYGKIITFTNHMCPDQLIKYINSMLDAFNTIPGYYIIHVQVVDHHQYGVADQRLCLS